MLIQLDPRTKLLMVAVAFLGTLSIETLPAELTLNASLLLPFFFSTEWRTGLRRALIYLVQLLVATQILPQIGPGNLYYMVSFFTVGLRYFTPSVIAATYALRTTSTGEWVALMKQWKAPRALIVLVAVAGRFMPTVRQDYQKIRQAMAFRGIGTSAWELLAHPIQSFEHILIPLLMNASQVSDDLTLSALSKGLSIEGPSTSIIRLKLTAWDWAYMIFIVGVFIFLAGRGF